MKKWLRFVVWTLLCFSGMTCVSAFSETAILAESAEPVADQDGRAYPAGNPEDVAAVILHTNDVHVAFEDNIGYDGLALQKSIDEVRENGADYVILVSHLGNNDSITAQFRCDPIVQKLSGLDMIIDGHSHEIYNRTVKDRTGKEIPIAQAGTKLNSIGHQA